MSITVPIQEEFIASYIASWNPENESYTCTCLVSTEGKLAVFEFGTTYNVTPEKGYTISWSNPDGGNTVIATYKPHQGEFFFTLGDGSPLDELSDADTFRFSVSQGVIEPKFREHQMNLYGPHKETDLHPATDYVSGSFRSSDRDFLVAAFFDEAEAGGLLIDREN